MEERFGRNRRAPQHFRTDRWFWVRALVLNQNAASPSSYSGIIRSWSSRPFSCHYVDVPFGISVVAARNWTWLPCIVGFGTQREGQTTHSIPQCLVVFWTAQPFMPSTFIDFVVKAQSQSRSRHWLLALMIWTFFRTVFCFRAGRLSHKSLEPEFWRKGLAPYTDLR